MYIAILDVFYVNNPFYHFNANIEYVNTSKYSTSSCSVGVVNCEPLMKCPTSNLLVVAGH
jgi:hypothetical protein